MAISLYPNDTTTIAISELSVIDFLDKIKNGYWQDEILALRTEKNPVRYKARKKALPNVTVSGTFSARTATTLIQHSGFIAIDIDHTDANTPAFKNKLCNDPLFFSVFISCSGKGLCALVKIEPEHHRLAYIQLSEYLKTTYGTEMSADPHCKNLARIRYVSYDPDLYLNTNSILFKAKPKKKKELPVKDYLIVPSDFEKVILELQERKIDVTEDYEDWCRLGFGLATSFGEDGREYFHQISLINDNYDGDECDEKYNNFLETKSGTLTICWFYDLLKRNYNIKAYSEKTEQILRAAQAAFDFRIVDGVEGIKEILRTKYDFTEQEIQDAEQLIAQAIIKRIPIGGDSLMADVEAFIYQRFEVKRNRLISTIEVDNQKLTQTKLNTIFTDTLKIYPKATIGMVRAIVNTDSTPSYDPVDDLINKYLLNPPLQPRGYIAALIATIKTDTPHAAYFIKKWMVAMIPSAKGEHSVLILVLCGLLNTGKTEWFRRYLPPSLKHYRADSRLDDGKDSDILMTKKLLILDDEMSGKSKQEQRKVKNTTSKQEINVRKPYDSEDSDLNRIAMLAATTNTFEIINDPTGNRRFIPVNVLEVDKDAYNAIDKELVLFECYLEWKAGFNPRLTNSDIELLKETSHDFIVANFTEELFFAHFADIGMGEEVIMTKTEIIIYLSRMCAMPSKIDGERISLILENGGFDKKRSATKRGWRLIIINDDFKNMI